MKLHEESINNKDTIVKKEQIDLVNYKLVMLFDSKKSIEIEKLKSMIRLIFNELGLGIRFRIDISEDNWLEKNSIEGKFLTVIRTKDKVIEEKLLGFISSKIDDLGLDKDLDIISLEQFNVDDFRNVSYIFDRAIYEVILDTKQDIVETAMELSGKWKRSVRLWNGEIVEETVKDIVRLKITDVESTSEIHKVIVDVPLGLDVYGVLEQELKLKKGSLLGYPVKGVMFYESINNNKSYLSRPKCKITGKPVEKTVGDYVGDRSVEFLF